MADLPQQQHTAKIKKQTPFCGY